MKKTAGRPKGSKAKADAAPKTAHGKTNQIKKRATPQKRYIGIDRRAINEGFKYFWSKRGRDVPGPSHWG